MPATGAERIANGWQAGYDDDRLVKSDGWKAALRSLGRNSFQVAALALAHEPVSWASMSIVRPCSRPGRWQR